MVLYKVPFHYFPHLGGSQVSPSSASPQPRPKRADTRASGAGAGAGEAQAGAESMADVALSGF